MTLLTVTFIFVELKIELAQIVKSIPRANATELLSEMRRVHSLILVSKNLTLSPVLCQMRKVYQRL